MKSRHLLLLFLFTLTQALTPVTSPGIDATFTFQSTQNGFCSGNYLQVTRTLDLNETICDVSNFVVDANYSVYVAARVSQGDCDVESDFWLIVLDVDGNMLNKTMAESRKGKIGSSFLYVINMTVILLTGTDAEDVKIMSAWEYDYGVGINGLWSHTLRIANYFEIDYPFYTVPGPFVVSDNAIYVMKYVSEHSSSFIRIGLDGESTEISSAFDVNNYFMAISPDLKRLYVLSQDTTQLKINLYAYRLNDTKTEWSIQQVGFNLTKQIDSIVASNEGVFIPFLNGDYVVYMITRDFHGAVVTNKNHTYDVAYPLTYSTGGHLFSCLGSKDFNNTQCTSYLVNKTKAQIAFTRNSTRPTYYMYDSSSNLMIVDKSQNRSNLQLVRGDTGGFARIPSRLNTTSSTFLLIAKPRNEGLVSLVTGETWIEYHHYQCQRGILGVSWVICVLSFAGIFIVACIIIGLCCCLCHGDREQYVQI